MWEVISAPLLSLTPVVPDFEPEFKKPFRMLNDQNLTVLDETTAVGKLSASRVRWWYVPGGFLCVLCCALLSKFYAFAKKFSKKLFPSFLIQNPTDFGETTCDRELPVSLVWWCSVPEGFLCVCWCASFLAFFHFVVKKFSRKKSSSNLFSYHPP